MNLQSKEIVQPTQRNFSFLKACLLLGKPNQSQFA